jgi:hypothetical protein
MQTFNIERTMINEPCEGTRPRLPPADEEISGVSEEREREREREAV